MVDERCKHSFSVEDHQRELLVCGYCGMSIPKELLRDADKPVVFGSTQNMLLAALFHDKQRIVSYLRGDGPNVNLVDDQDQVIFTVPRPPRPSSTQLIDIVWERIQMRLFCPICGKRSAIDSEECGCLRNIYSDLIETTKDFDV